MWDIENADPQYLPYYVAAAILDAQQWLLYQQYAEGLSHSDNRGASWVISPRLAGKHFGVARFPGRGKDDLLILAKPDERWAESRTAESIPSGSISKHPLAWFAAIPWQAHLSRNRDYLVLLCPEQHLGGKTSPAWTLTIPVALRVWKWLYADMQKASSSTIRPSRFALGDGVFVPVLGFDVEWGSLVSVPVRIDPLMLEFRKKRKLVEPVFNLGAVHAG